MLIKTMIEFKGFKFKNSKNSKDNYLIKLDRNNLIMR